MMKLCDRRVWRYLGLAILAVSSAAARSDCEVLKAIPAGSYAVGSEELNNPTSSKLSLSSRVAASGKDISVAVDIPEKSGLIWLSPTIKGSYSPLCVTQNLPQGKSIYRVGSFDSVVNVTLGGTPGSKAKFTVYTSGQVASAPDRPAIPLRVRVPVEVFIFDNSPLTDIDAHLSAATEIWARADVVLAFKVRRLDAEKTKEILGADATILTYMGCSQRFEKGFEQRDALSKLKSNPLAMGVFFAPNKTQSQAEPEFMQAYISNDPFASPKGRTVAHEIGHLLLGEGHPGGKMGKGLCTRARADDAAPVKETVMTTSGLMEPANSTSSTTIDTEDAKLARQKAVTLPGATWW